MKSRLFLLLLLCVSLPVLAKPKPPTTESRIAALEAKVAELETLLGSVYRLIDPNTGQDTLRFEGMNVQIVNGTEHTDQINQTGNLIIGYNETRIEVPETCPDPARFGCNRRGGSHNLILGFRNNYASSAGIVAGVNNEIAGPGATITGGLANRAVGELSSVSGGSSNQAIGETSSITGGDGNVAFELGSSVSGGQGNTVNGWFASVSGGYNNAAFGVAASISGGSDNIASAENSSVSGGTGMTAGTLNCTVADNYTDS